jgi:ubiquinone biosynthesis protein
MEKIEGFKITNMKKLIEGGYDLEDLSRKFTLSFFKQVFTDGFFHGDPHPGNVLINEGTICFIDFGIMGNLSKSLRSALNDAVTAIAFKDTDKLVSVLLSIGIRKGYIDRSKLYEDVNYLLSSYISTSLQNIKISVAIQEVIECAKRNNLALPKDFTMLMRSMLIVEGVVAKINPDMKVVDIAVSFVKSSSKSFLFNELNSDELILRTYNFIKDSSKIPTKFIELSDAVLNGRAKIKFELASLDKSIGELNKMTNRLVFALIVSAMIMGSSMILNSNAGPKIYNTSILGILGFGAAAFLGFWLLISILHSGKM